MKTKSLLLLVVAGACGLVAAFAAAQHLAGNQTPVPIAPSEEQRNVVIAVADVEAGVSLKADMLRVVPKPVKDLPDGTFTAVAELTGQPLRYPVFKGEPVLAGKVGRSLESLATDLPEGMKACTVRISDEENSMRGLIKPGNHVDVFWLPMKSDLSSSSVMLLLQNVKVLAVGERIEGDNEALDARANKSYATENFTLLVDSRQNKRVIAATSKGGKFRLVLRRRGDNSLEESDEARLDKILSIDPSEEIVATDVHVESEPLTWEVEYLNGGEQKIDRINMSEGRHSSAKK